MLVLFSCNDYSNYFSYDETRAGLSELPREYPSICELWDIGSSHEERMLIALKITGNTGSDEPKPVIYIEGGIHGNEWISVNVTYHIAKYLLENYASDTTVRKIVDHLEIWIIPMLNPDGHVVLENQTNLDVSSFLEIGRKNRYDGSKLMSGVDLNRNFNSNWGDTADGTSLNPLSPYYCGEAPFSEPETLAVRDLLNRIKPSLTIHYHNYGQHIAYAAENDGESAYLAENMAAAISAVNGVSYAFKHTYKSGGAKEWIYDTFSCPSFLVELRPKTGIPGYMLPESKIEATVKENIEGALFLLSYMSGIR